MKIGRLADVTMRGILESDAVNANDVGLLQDKAYCKDRFGVDYPVLVADTPYVDSERYYVEPVTIDGKKYRLTNMWFETDANNDRPGLVSWIVEHITYA